MVTRQPMTMEQKIAKVRAILNDNVVTDSQIQAYLELARDEILSWGHRYSSEELVDVPWYEEPVQIMSVVVGYSQQGAEGEIQHNENGISRIFNNDSMIGYIHKYIIPKVKII